MAMTTKLPGYAVGHIETLRARAFWDGTRLPVPSTKAAPNELDQVRCQCGGKSRLVHRMLDSRTGGTLRMYKCDCGEQAWSDVPT
jgi:hypothetical protein